jgi:hypothetical protein
LKSGRATSCGCKKLFYIGKISSAYWTPVKNSVATRGIEFGISHAEASELFESQDGKCAISGLDIYFGKRLRESTASLDRIDSSLPYSVGNCQWVDRRINYMKQSYSLPYFLGLCGLIAFPLRAVSGEKPPQPYAFTTDLSRRTGFGGITGSVWSEVANTSKLFEVSIEQVWDLFVKQMGRCALSGIKLVLPETHRDLRRRTASLDRIDSKLGYVEGNIQWIFKDINFMKQELPESEFVHLCGVIAENAAQKRRS